MASATRMWTHSSTWSLVAERLGRAGSVLEARSIDGVQLRRATPPVIHERRDQDPPEPQARTAVSASEPTAQQNGKPEASKIIRLPRRKTEEPNGRREDSSSVAEERGSSSSTPVLRSSERGELITPTTTPRLLHLRRPRQATIIATPRRPQGVPYSELSPRLGLAGLVSRPSEAVAGTGVEWRSVRCAACWLARARE
jgi:hypothetical protein